MTKYLDTSTLTKYTSGNNKGHFNWKENIENNCYYTF